MQKTFIKFTFAIITAAIFIILGMNALFTLRSFEQQKMNTFKTKISQVIHTLENNEKELSVLKKNLDEDYLTRAKAAAYVWDRQKKKNMKVEEMQYLADLLDVDEMHVIDENGFIIAGSVSDYVGFDMNEHPQTRAFLELFQNTEENPYLIQEPQPNAAEEKVMQYAGVLLKDRNQIVQVGFEPVRQMAAQAGNTYEYIFSQFPTDTGEEFFVVDIDTKRVLGHSNGLDFDFTEESYDLDYLIKCNNGAYLKGVGGETMYIVTEKYKNAVICAATPKNKIMQRLRKNVLNIFVYLVFVEAAVILLLNYLVKRKVVDGIHSIIEDLSAITEGNLDTTVAVAGNPEFQTLSTEINKMVKSIVSASDRMSAIIEISGMSLAAFEYDRRAQHVFITSGLKDMLALSEQEASVLYKNPFVFDQYIQKVIKNPVKNEEDIFQINESKYIRLHMIKTSDGYIGAVTDVTKEIIDKKKMQYENTHDYLTGLYKFQYFKQKASEIIRNMKQEEICAAVMVDLDSFKSINDTFGHDAGDKYLQGFSSVLKSMPAKHFLTSRRSGDEFCMMVYGCRDKSAIRSFLDSFYKTLADYSVVLTDTQKSKISASSGFACTKNKEEELADLLSHADEALYEMKRKSKGYYFEYQPENIQA